MLSRRYLSARSSMDSHQSDEMVMKAKSKLLEVADRLQQLQDLLTVTTIAKDEFPLNSDNASSLNLSYTLSNALELSPLSITSPFSEPEDELQKLLREPLPSALLAVPDISYPPDSHDADPKARRSIVAFLPIDKSDNDEIPTHRTIDRSPDGWSDEESCIDENVIVKHPPVSLVRGGILWRPADLAQNEMENSEASEDSGPDDSLWEDENSFLLREDVPPVRNTGGRVRVPPLNLFGLERSPCRSDGGALKSSQRLSQRNCSKSTESILNLCETLETISDEILHHARSTRIFAENLQQQNLRLNDDLQLAYQKNQDLIYHLEELERRLGERGCNKLVICDLETPKMSPSPLKGFVPLRRLMTPRNVEQSNRNESNLTTRENSPSLKETVEIPTETVEIGTETVEIGTASRAFGTASRGFGTASRGFGTASRGSRKSGTELGTSMTPSVIVKLREKATSPICILQRDFGCLIKPIARRRWTRVNHLPKSTIKESSQCNWEWFRKYVFGIKIDS